MTLLMMGLIIIPSLILVLVFGLLFWLAIGSKQFFKLSAIITIIGAVLILAIFIGNFLNSKTTVGRNDIIGTYVIDRTKYSGKQADLQYNHYRFEVFENNTIEFYLTENEEIIKTYQGKVYISNDRNALHITMEDKDFHVTKRNPAFYRLNWSFYYVFHSDKYNNMFFVKGNYKPTNSKYGY